MADAADILDYAILYRETLQGTSSIAGAVNLWQSFSATRAVGFNTPISTPYRLAVSKVHGYHSEVEEHDYRFHDMLSMITSLDFHGTPFA